MAGIGDSGRLQILAEKRVKGAMGPLPLVSGWRFSRPASSQAIARSRVSAAASASAIAGSCEPAESGQQETLRVLRLNARAAVLPNKQPSTFLDQMAARALAAAINLVGVLGRSRPDPEVRPTRWCHMRRDCFIRAQNSVCVMPDSPERSATDHRAFRCTDVSR
jgi:hypothetical protein